MMIISASRRTDIPALYPEWMRNRLKEGYVLMPNPRNANRLGRVSLSPKNVDCIVFWTKNPQPTFRYFEQTSKIDVNQRKAFRRIERRGYWRI